MNKRLSRSIVAAVSSVVLLGALAIQPAQAAGYVAPVNGSYVMRLVSPLPGSTNSVNLTADAKGDWDQFYGKGLNAFIMYADVKGDVSLTYKYTNAAGVAITNATVYLIVNKKYSCSKTTFSTTMGTNYPGSNRPNTSSIVRDWCGDQPQMGAGETAIIGRTDSFGKATYTMKNWNLTGEQFPSAINKMNQYSKGIPCGDDTMCLQTTLAPSMSAHPSEAAERGEDKDLLFLHFVNPKLTALNPTQKVKAGTSKKLSFKLTNLAGAVVKGTTVTFESFGEGNDVDEWSEISDKDGLVSTTVTAPKGTLGLQVIRAKVYGANKGTDAKVYWIK
ncbi:MAG: hypothetical protein F2662_00100 [Actinobacteria bacterium]|uniref:Unannotated protein n=1 Tax=freshwater metagenome TaxID=449393 RepID=A0A6J6MYP5_9ZZZZ|nr:hypothetical protein [Actinomycetota bacterium]